MSASLWFSKVYTMVLIYFKAKLWNSTYFEYLAKFDHLYVGGGPFFRTNFKIWTTLKFGWVSGSGDRACSDWKMKKKSVRPKKSPFCGKNQEREKNFLFKCTLVDSTLSQLPVNIWIIMNTTVLGHTTEVDVYSRCTDFLSSCSN